MTFKIRLLVFKGRIQKFHKGGARPIIMGLGGKKKRYLCICSKRWFLLCFSYKIFPKLPTKAGELWDPPLNLHLLFHVLLCKPVNFMTHIWVTHFKLYFNLITLGATVTYTNGLCGTFGWLGGFFGDGSESYTPESSLVSDLFSLSGDGGGFLFDLFCTGDQGCLTNWDWYSVLKENFVFCLASASGDTLAWERKITLSADRIGDSFTTGFFQPNCRRYSDRKFSLFGLGITSARPALYCKPRLFYNKKLHYMLVNNVNACQ